LQPFAQPIAAAPGFGNDAVIDSRRCQGKSPRIVHTQQGIVEQVRHDGDARRRNVFLWE
jgi:hypothetical protein